MRRAEVRSRFLKQFDVLYPQLQFRRLHLMQNGASEYSLSLALQVGTTEAWVDVRFVILTEGTLEQVTLYLERVVDSAREDWLPAFLAPGFAPKATQLIQEAGLAHFDLVGNLYLAKDNVYVSVSGRPNSMVPKSDWHSPFEGKRERVVRRLLMAPERSWRMRALAKAADVSVGLASMTTSDVEEMGGLAKQRVGLSVFDPGGVLDAWTRSYDLHRSPFTTYSSQESLPVLLRRLAMCQDRLEGELALTLWTAAQEYLNIESLSPHLALYWTRRPQELAEALGWTREVSKTRIFIFQPYDESVLWDTRKTAEGVPVVHPLQLYLDLAAGDERELEIAQELRARLLDW